MREGRLRADPHRAPLPRPLPSATCPLPSALCLMFIRFISDRIHKRSGEPMGIFAAMALLPRTGHLPDWEEQYLDEQLSWFWRNLPQPTRMARHTRRHGAAKALSWFKAGAREHVSRARDLAALLGEHDIRIRMVFTDRPGYVVYEDKYQLVAEPFRAELRLAQAG